MSEKKKTNEGRIAKEIINRPYIGLNGIITTETSGLFWV